MDILKRKWKEIAIVGGIILSIILVYFLIKYLLNVREEAIYYQQLTENNYNNILSGETSEEILEKELAVLIDEEAKLERILSKNFKIQDAYEELVNIIMNTKILNIDNCTVDERTTPAGAKYKVVEIKVKSFYGTYAQVKEFLDFIKNYERKIVIEKMDFEVEDFTKNMKGENLIITLYGMPEEES